MKKKFVMILLCGILLVSVTGCGNEKQETKINETDKQQETTKKDSEKIFEIKSGARYTWSSDEVGIQIDLLNDNKVVSSSRTKSGKFDEYYGTYSINGNELTINLTQKDSDDGKVSYNEIKNYKIISDTEFKDEEDNVYSFKTSLDK
ncbi:MAG: hypothetical protein HFJ12_00630 [Bacilli bacterium]|nr:hypothetical protein [Bacilli bacterium]